jgi:hypothetical protein
MAGFSNFGHGIFRQLLAMGDVSLQHNNQSADYAGYTDSKNVLKGGSNTCEVLL